MKTFSPCVTIAIPVYNQANFLEKALSSVFEQTIPVEVFVMDGGSTDGSMDIVHAWAHRLAGWRSRSDDGQSAAINEGIAQGSAPYVCWLNSDDWLLPTGLAKLVDFLKNNPASPAVYGRTWNLIEQTGKMTPAWVEGFDEDRLALRCIISQPATLIKRAVWEQVGGLDTTLHMAMDYDLWWRIYKQAGPLKFLDDFIAVNRDHSATKTNTKRQLHYREAIKVIRKYYGSVPIKWWIFQPYAVWFKTLKSWIIVN